MNYDKYVPFAIASGAAYAANGSFRLAYDDVQPLPGGGVTFVRGVDLQFDSVMISTGATSPLPESNAHRWLDQLKHTQVGGHVFYDLGEQAGVVISKLLHAMTGKRPEPGNGGAGGAITIGTTNTDVRLKVYLPYCLPGSIEADDANIPLSDLSGSALEGRYVNGATSGAYDSGATDERIVSGTLRASIDLIHRDEARRATYFSIVSEEASGPEHRLFIAGKVLVFLLEVPVHADGVTENFITDAERDAVTLDIDDTTPVDREDAKDLNARWNRVHAASRDEMLPNHEGNASPFVVLYAPARRPYKLTQCPAPIRKAKLRTTGTDTTPRLVHVTTTLHDRETLMSHFKKWNGGDLPEGFEGTPEAFLSSKTASKTDFAAERAGSDGVQRLPIKLKIPKAA